MENTGGTGTARARVGDVPSDTFAARLMLARHHAGRLSQREAAVKCGLNYASWSNWEDGRHPRDLLDVVRKIADGLEINHEWLLFGGALTEGRPRAGQTPYSASLPDRPRDNRTPNRRNGPSGGPGRVTSSEDNRRPVRRRNPASMAPLPRAA